jgi:hypothetical protein
MADREALRLRHIGRREEIDVGARFDLLAHQAGWAEFRDGDRIRACRKAAKQVGEGTRETARARHMQHVRPRHGHQAQDDKNGQKAITHMSSFSL